MGPTDNLDRELESRLAGLTEAERAGVFRPTRLDATRLMRVGGPGRFAALRWVAAATLFFMVTAGVWTAMFRWNLADLRQTFASAPITDCLAGPRGNLPASCNTHDLDADGDVDLADLSSFQTAYAQR